MFNRKDGSKLDNLDPSKRIVTSHVDKESGVEYTETTSNADVTPPSDIPHRPTGNLGLDGTPDK